MPLLLAQLVDLFGGVETGRLILVVCYLAPLLSIAISSAARRRQRDGVVLVLVPYYLFVLYAYLYAADTASSAICTYGAGLAGIIIAAALPLAAKPVAPVRRDDDEAR